MRVQLSVHVFPISHTNIHTYMYEHTIGHGFLSSFVTIFVKKPLHEVEALPLLVVQSFYIVTSLIYMYMYSVHR